MLLSTLDYTCSLDRKYRVPVSVCIGVCLSVSTILALFPVMKHGV